MLRIALLASVLFFCEPIFSQDSLAPKPDTVLEVGTSSIFSDSLEKAQSMKQMDNNLQAFMRMQKEREAKQKRQAYIRIGIGVLFFIVLIVGLRRKRKK